MRARTTVIALSAAGLLTFTSSGTAQAATYYRTCDTTGASGSASFDMQQNGPGNPNPYVVVGNLSVVDTKGDGNHVRVRFTWAYPGQTSRASQWFKNTLGNGKRQSWDFRQDLAVYPRSLGVQVARYEGDRYLNSCSDWT
ncbi:hypothetical protein G6045_16445 [Streptomyces sp. YC504]|uniref:Secreted protein n=1 Tax=Streptomyces mesophilus TaxID=1775132 RepID=A0A6G4XI58_9ACTN|nr:hypothetical protein [Streptomyces mesophilus]NGO77235.1 hypothetical protein [Streptomyces mesophilus]